MKISLRLSKGLEIDGIKMQQTIISKLISWLTFGRPRFDSIEVRMKTTFTKEIKFEAI